jgi:hypothetical protein
MSRCFIAAAIFLSVSIILAAQQTGPYKVLKRAKVGGEGGWDYIYADSQGRRLYIPRRGAGEIPTRLTMYDLDTLEPVGEIAGIGGQGAAVDLSRVTVSRAASPCRCSIPKPGR